MFWDIRHKESAGIMGGKRFQKIQLDAREIVKAVQDNLFILMVKYENKQII